MSKTKLLFFLCMYIGSFGTACSTDAHKSAAQKAEHGNPDRPASEGLDLLTDYDRDIWSGPDSWSEVQWQWKKRLRWDKECDYVGEVEVHPIAKNQQLIQVMCVPGSYQPMSYLFLYNPNSKESKQLALGAGENTDQAKEIWGNMEFNERNSYLSITTLSRGVGDCGVYRVFSFKAAEVLPKLIEKRKRDCSEGVLPENPPEEIFNPKKWPLVKGEEHTTD